MRRTLLLCIALALGATLTAQTRYIALEQIAVAGTAIGFTAATITPPGQPMATQAVCRARTAEMSWRVDGGTPTSTVGTLIEVGEVLVITGHDNLVRFKAIRTGSSGSLDCTVSAQ